MKYQSQPYSCGPASIINAIRVFGKKIDERRVIPLADTTDDGTYPEGIVSAVRSLGYTAVEYSATSSNEAWKWLRGSLLQGSAIILNVDTEGHWVTVIGLAGDRVILIDSVLTANNERENGVHVLTKTTLTRRWRSSRNLADNNYYAVCISKAKST